MRTDVSAIARARCPAALTVLTMLLRWPDCTLGRRFVEGFRLIGAIEAPGIFRDISPMPPEALGLPALLGDHAARVVGKLERTLPNFPFQDEAKAFTLQEVAQGLAHGPYTKADLDKAHGSNSWIPMRRFMLPQSSKLRAIDDGRFSGHNQASYACLQP